MCQAMTGSGGFDVSLCPLLQHLSPEEQQERMRNDPSIAACIGAMSGSAMTDDVTGRRVQAYRSLCLAGDAAPRAKSTRQ